MCSSDLGPPRKYYKITGVGLDELTRLSDEWYEFTSSINELLKGDFGSDESEKQERIS